jgi:flagellum-specific ATP synthase
MLELDEHLETVIPTALTGSVVQTVGMTAAVADFPVPVGASVEIERQAGEPIEAEVIGFRDQYTLVYPLSSMTGVRRGNRVRLVRTKRTLPVGNELLGRVINGLGRAIDGKPQPMLPDRARLDRQSPSPIERPRIDAPLATGIRTIDGLLTCGKGQRMGIFSGSGVGKSVLLGMMARYTAADVNVIALVGERGREVNEFIQRDLGPEGLDRSVVVVATSDEPALVRVHAAYTATTVAEFFRDQGKDVLLLMDSVTRFAMAQREIGLAAGEPPTTRGYTPSVFGLLPKLIERAGQARRGSITAFYSVLVEGDDINDPVADALRGLLDGHTWLARKLAVRGHYPAIDILESISRLMVDVIAPEQQNAAVLIRQLLSAYRDHEDVISIGAYRRGSNHTVDCAMDMLAEIDAFLKQDIGEASPYEATRSGLSELASRCRAHGSALVAPEAAPAGRAGAATPVPQTT